MYTMKEVCRQTELPYETLKYYCKEGLIPNVKRDEHNYRIFDDQDLAWVKSLTCLKKCGMSISDMKQYVSLCLHGEDSIYERKKILENRKHVLLKKRREIDESLCYINEKQKYYDDVLAKKTKYVSNLLPDEEVCND